MPATATFMRAAQEVLLGLLIMAATALLRCRMYGITPPVDAAADVASIASKVHVPDFR